MTKIALFEDNSDKAESAIRAIDKSGHELWRHLEDFPQAISAIADLNSDVGAAVVDGNLGIMGGTRDGEEIIRRIDELRTNIVTIGNSVGRDVPGAKFQARGLNSQLCDILLELSEKGYYLS